MSVEKSSAVLALARILLAAAVLPYSLTLDSRSWTVHETLYVEEATLSFSTSLDRPELPDLNSYADPYEFAMRSDGV